VKSLTGKRIWITGASSGIGRGLAAALAGLGNDVVVSGRNMEQLQITRDSCPERIRCIPFDIADRAANIKAADEIEKQLGGLDISVLNAGTCEYLDARDFDSEMVRRVTEINYIGFVYGVEASLNLLRKGKDPYLVGMSSTVAYTGLPRAEAYGATKAAIRSFLQSLRLDLAAEGIDVSIICPGFVKTPLTDRNDFPMPMRISTAKAAEYIVKGMRRRKHEIAFPPLFAWTLKLIAALPSRARNMLLIKLVRGS
jgi:NAD(P)-dependent dehydrogenase (short-subunit alcohol dehydrogenase family)